MCSREEVEASIEESHSDLGSELPLNDCPFQVPKESPSIPFNMSDFTLKEVKTVVNRARAGSAPGPSGTMYKIYKNCPLLLARLAKLLKTLWRKK